MEVAHRRAGVFGIAAVKKMSQNLQRLFPTRTAKHQTIATYFPYKFAVDATFFPPEICVPELWEKFAAGEGLNSFPLS